MSRVDGKLNFNTCRTDLDGRARKGGAVVTGVADASAFTNAPEGWRIDAYNEKNDIRNKRLWFRRQVDVHNVL